MFWTTSTLPTESRARICATLNARIADGVDLATQLRVVRWNLRGVAFARVQPLLHVIETDLQHRLDHLAERVVALGGRAFGSARYAAHASRIQECWSGSLGESDQVLLAADRIGCFLEGVREARRIAEGLQDTETVAVLASLVRDFERAAFTLRGATEMAAAEPAMSASAPG